MYCMPLDVVALHLRLRVFEPRKPNHNGVEEGQHDQIPRVGERVPVHLVGGEEPKDSYRRRVGPEPPLQQSRDQCQLGDSMGQQVNGAKQLAPSRQSLAQRDEITGDEIMWISAQLVLCELSDQRAQVGGTDGEQQEAANNLEHTIETLEAYSDLEGSVESARLHRSLPGWSTASSSTPLR